MFEGEELHCDLYATGLPSAQGSPVYVPRLGSDFEGQGGFEGGGALRDEVEPISSRRKPSSGKLVPKPQKLASSTLSANAQAVVPIGSAGPANVTPDCPCKSKQATEGDRLAALAAMKLLAQGGPDNARRDLASKMQFM